MIQSPSPALWTQRSCRQPRLRRPPCCGPSPRRSRWARAARSIPMPPYYAKFAPADLKIEVDRFRQPDRRQERRGHQVGRFRHLRHRRRHPGRRGRRAGRGGGRHVQQAAWASISKAGSDVKTIKDLQGQEDRHLAGLDAGGLHHGAPAHGGPVDQGHHPGARAVRRDAGHAGARRRRRLCRRRAGPGALDHLGRRPARRVSLRHGDGRPEHDLRHPRGDRRQEPRPGAHHAQDPAPGGRVHDGQQAAPSWTPRCRSSAPAAPPSSRRWAPTTSSMSGSSIAHGAGAEPRPTPSTCSS